MKMNHLPAASMAVFVRTRAPLRLPLLLAPLLLPGEKAGMRAVTQKSQLLRNPLISRFSKFSFNAVWSKVPEKPDPVESHSLNPQSASRNSRATTFVTSQSQQRHLLPAPPRRLAHEPKSGTTRNVPSLFHHVSPFVPHRKLLFLKALQERFNLFRHIPLSIPLSEWSNNSAQPTTLLRPKDLRLIPHASNQHTPTHCRTLNFLPRQVIPDFRAIRTPPSAFRASSVSP